MIFILLLLINLIIYFIIILLIVLCSRNTNTVNDFQMKSSNTKKIILIGNAPIEKQNGVQIDQFDIIVRFNEFKIEGFEKFIGTKTTHWFVSGLIYNKYKDIAESEYAKLSIENKFVVMLDSSIRNISDKRFDIVTSYMTNKIFPRDIYNKYFKPDATKCDKKYCYYDYPSTGLMAIFYFLYIQSEPIYLSNFNFFDKNNDLHYYNDKKLLSYGENPNYEKEIITRLVENKKIIFL